jgi:sec-independent protein translocase protein TatA
MFGVSHLPELLILLLIVVLVFGVGKFSDVGGAVGKSIREFRKETRGDGDSVAGPTDSTP